MLDKSICDCNAPTRQLLKEAGIVDYDQLELGEKVQVNARMEGDDVVVSCYRANGRGDKRIWFNKAKQRFQAGDKIALKVRAKKLYLEVEGK